MFKRVLSILLAVMLLVGTVPVSAVEVQELDPMEVYLASLGAFTETPVNPVAAPAEPEDDIPADAEITPNVVLFALQDGTALSALTDEIAALGVSDIQPVLSEAAAFSVDSDALIWYRAACAGDERETALQLRAVDGVAAAELEYIYHTDAIGEPTEIEMSHNWAAGHLLKKSNKHWWKEDLKQSNAPGEGVVVAVIDTGVDYTHEDLVDNMWVNMAELNGTTGVDDDGNGYIDDIYGANVTASGKQAGDPMDDNGHGTHVAGIIAMTPNKVGAVGIAWGAKIMAIKAGQSTGSFTSSDIAEAIQYAHMMGADVINMSFGGTSKSYQVEQALSSAFADCVLVAAAGNDGLPTTDAPSAFQKKEDIYPAAYPYVLGVMATDSKGELAGFSNWDYESDKNAEYELTAPGENIYSTLPGNRYATWSGTSMAAPCVSAAAAIVRSKFADKDTYSSRFIMGQLVSATEDTTTYIDQLRDGHVYAALNIYDSCVYLPKPNVSVPEIFLLDNVTTSNEINDGDRIMDAGETVDMGFTVRNQWGQTGEITVKADAISEGGVANPYVEFLVDEVTLSPAGTFGESDNGYVREDSYLASVTDPIRFVLASDTPNDAEICINLTVTTSNGADSGDKATYTAEASYTFRVQNGRGIKGQLTKDTTLTADHYWIVENTILIPEGITLTVEPGAQIQFYSSDYEDAYGGKTLPGIVNYGTLNMIGTEEKPISCFPGAGFEDYMVVIYGEGKETLQYCEIINPRLGNANNAVSKHIFLVDHCRLTQNTGMPSYRYLSGTEVKRGVSSAMVCTEKLTNSALYGILTGTWGTAMESVCTAVMENTLINDGAVSINSRYEDGAYRFRGSGNVFMPASAGAEGVYEAYTANSNLAGAAIVPRFVPSGDRTLYTYEGAESKYLCFAYPSDYYFDPASVDYEGFRLWLARAAAEELGGHLIILNDETEENYLREVFAAASRKLGYGIKVELDCAYDAENAELLWADGSSYVPEARWGTTPSGSSLFQRIVYQTRLSSTGAGFNLEKSEQNGYGKTSYYIEIPASKSDAEILAALDAFDAQQWAYNYFTPAATNNAIINPVLNNDTSNWAIYKANGYNTTIAGYNISGNYWGTENQTLINKMIIDADDYAGTLGDVVEDPILTLESESLEDIYPFVTAMWLEDADGNTVTTAAPGGTYTVHVTYNRDMDPDVQPTVTYGPAKPYTDFTVRGDWAGDREWVGTTTISPVMSNGTQYFRTTGGAAADDGWLVCGNDILRFCFDVSATGALAMTLQATGGAGKVELEWMQDDFDTLAGCNLYRSTKPDGTFTKINTSILTDTAYVDTNVQQGVTYYYYFKVVNTEGNEEEKLSNVAYAAPLDGTPPVLTHTPLTSATYNTGITVSATATDNIGVTSVTLYYRPVGAETYSSKTMVVSGSRSRYVGTIPADAVTMASVEYYVEARDAAGNVTSSGTAEQPNAVTVTGIPPLTVTEQPEDATVYDGATASFRVTATGDHLTYQWQRYVDGQWLDAFEDNATAKTANFVTVPVNTDLSGLKIRCKITDAYRAVAYTDEVTLTVLPVPALTGQPESVTKYVGETAVFTAAAAGAELTYQWQFSKNGGDSWSNATATGNKSATLTVPATANRDGYQYRCVVTDLGKTVLTSDAATLTVLPRLTITGQPESAVVYDGDTAAFTVEATGRGLSYQWERYVDGQWLDAFEDNATAKTANFVTVPVNTGISGLKIRCRITDQGKTTCYTDAVTLTVLERPAILEQPEDAIVYEGESATFRINAVGAGLQYQWEYYVAGEWVEAFGVDATAKTAQLVTEQAGTDLNGVKVRCVVTDQGKTVLYTDEVTLSVRTRLTVTAQPEDTSAYVGDTVEFTVEATGEGLSYQWEYRYAGTLARWKASPLKTSIDATLSIPATLGRSGCVYRCRVTDKYGNVDYTDGAVLTVTEKPIAPSTIVITGQPESVSAYAGDTVEFTVTAEGEELTYQWEYHYGDAPWQNSPLKSCTTATLSVPATLGRTGCIYRCKITDKNGYVEYTEAVVLTVTEKPVAPSTIVITGQPESVSAYAGDTVEFTVTAEGEELTYQWEYHYGDAPWQNSPLKSSTAATLSVPATLGRTGCIYRCKITDKTGYVEYTEAIVLTVTEKIKLPVIVAQSQDQTVGPDDAVTLTVTAEGEGLTYQWEFRAKSTDAWTIAQGTGNKTAAMTFAPATMGRNGYQYRCVVTNAGGTVYSDVVTLTVQSAFAITGQPESAEAYVGDTATFTVEAIGDGITYQWQYKAPGYSWKNSPAPTTDGGATLIVALSDGIDRNGYQYRCVVTDQYGTKATSAAATLTVEEEKVCAEITGQPESAEACVGDTATFTVEAIGDGITYQWQYKAPGYSWKNSPATGSTTATLSVPATTGRNGYQYRCVVTDSNGEQIISAVASLTVAK